MIKAVIFDVDGTLVDSNDLHVGAWLAAFEHFGKQVTREQVHPQMGKGNDQFLPVFLSPEEMDKYGAELEQYRVELFTREYLPRVRPFPQVRELLERVKAEGLHIVLASSAKEEELQGHKKNAGIEDLIEAATSSDSDDVEKSKPHPDVFQAALARLSGVAPEEAIVIGDTPYDVEAASKAGIKTIAVLSGGFTEERLLQSGAISIYRDIADLLEHFDESPLVKEKARASISR